MKNKILNYWPVIFMFVIWFIFANPYFLKGLVPYASRYQVNFFPPWSSYEKFWGPVKNNAMPDIHGQIYPWKKLTIDTFMHGQIPLWNPYSFSGNPHLANYQSAVFSPFNLLFFVLPFIDAWSILVLLQPLIAGLFMYLFVREIGVGRIGSLVSGVSFMFSGFMVVWMAYGTLSYAILYLPLALFAVERYYRSGSLKFLFLLTLTIPLSFFSGHFQISFYFFIALIYYILFRAFVKRSIQLTTFLLISVVFGLIIAAPQLASSVTLYKNSIRSELFQVGEVIPFQYLITVIAPDFFGNPVTRNDWFGHYAEWSSFIGIWSFFLAIYAITRFRSSRTLLFSILGFGSLALAVNSPLSVLLVSLKIPVLSTSALSRIIVLFSFSFATLAGLGFDALQNDLKSKKNKKAIQILLLMLAFLIAVWLLILIGKMYPSEWLIVAKRNFVLPTVLFGIGLFVLLLNIFLKHKRLIIITSIFLLLASSFDSLRFVQKWMPFDPKEYVFPEVPVISAIKKNINDGRIFGNIGGEVTTYYKFPSIEGYDPLYIERYGEFIRSASIGKLLKAERSVVKIDRRGKYANRVLDLLGVSLIFHPVADTNQGWAFPVWENKTHFSLIYKDGKFELFRNNLSLPRSSLFYDYEIITDKEAIIKRFYDENFEFRKKIILEEKASTPIGKGKGKAEIVLYSPNKVAIHVDTTTSALFFLSDNYYPGWKATVNGKEAKIYRANYTFRATVVPEGRSRIEFKYNLSSTFLKPRSRLCGFGGFFFCVGSIPRREKVLDLFL